MRLVGDIELHYGADTILFSMPNKDRQWQIYRMDADGQNIRQLCFDQDHNYCPIVTNDGRIMYLRWEYTDIPHVWGRVLIVESRH